MSAQPYQPDDLVYIDPAAREVVGAVEFGADGQPKSRPYPRDGQKKSSRRFCPYGRYESMCRAFRLDGYRDMRKQVEEGEEGEEEGGGSLDEMLPRMLNDAM